MLTPTKPLIKFQSGLQTEAFQWLRSIQPATPEPGLQSILPIDTDPETPPPAQSQTPYPNPPIDLQTTCPETGAPLRLHLFRDLSAVLMRDRNPAGWEVLPAALAIASQTYDAFAKEIPWEVRESTAPYIRFQAHADGLRWQAFNTTLQQHEVVALIHQTMQDTARRILDTPPVADPRIFSNIPEGARFAPWALWPVIDPEAQTVKTLATRVNALVQHFAQTHDEAIPQVSLCRHRPDEPWSTPNRSQVVSCAAPSLSRDAEKALKRILRALMAHPQLGLPDALRLGDDNTLILALDDYATPDSAHARMNAYRIVREISEHISLDLPA